MNNRNPNASKISLKHPSISTNNYESDGKDINIKIEVTKKILREGTKKYISIK